MFGGLVPTFEGPIRLQTYIFDGFFGSKAAPCPWKQMSGCLDLAEIVAEFILSYTLFFSFNTSIRHPLPTTKQNSQMGSYPEPILGQVDYLANFIN